MGSLEPVSPHISPAFYGVTAMPRIDRAGLDWGAQRTASTFARPNLRAPSHSYLCGPSLRNPVRIAGEGLAVSAPVVAVILPFDDLGDYNKRRSGIGNDSFSAICQVVQSNFCTATQCPGITPIRDLRNYNMTETSKTGTYVDVPSPFCGVGTDDLKISVDGTKITVQKNGCTVNTPAFEQPVSDTDPRVDGKVVRLEDAVGRAVEIIKGSQLPLIAGLATDVNGMRAALSLADKTGAVMDNMNFNGALRNFLVIHDSGWMNTTLAEVKNRCDLLLVMGVDLEPLYPRFFERYIWNAEAMHIEETSKRQVVYLGRAPSGKASTSPDGRDPKTLLCTDEDLPEVVAVLRALVNGNPVTVADVGGILVSDLQALAEQLKQASYGVVTWAAGALDFPQADLTVQTLCEMVKELNETTRCSGLPLGGKEGDQTAFQVSGWQTGYPSRVNFASGAPEYDPYLNSTDFRLSDGSVDALLWISAFNSARRPPPTDIPTVVLGRSGMQFDKQPDVYIPVGTPGIDHSGHAYRTDNVVAVRLRKLRDTPLPNTADVLSTIEQAL